MSSSRERLDRLWRRATAAARGPRPKLTLDRLVDDAIAIADADGIDAVTMRVVAARAGVAPMALYRYVDDKEELVDLMLDRIFATMRRSPTRGRGWRARLTAVADDNRALYLEHPWAAHLVTNRPPLGPGTLGKYELELQALEGTGLPDVEKDAALTFLLTFVEASARRTASAERARRGERSDRRWWEENGPHLAQLVDAGTYPTASRVGLAAGAQHDTAYDADATYQFGLERVLDGLAALIERRRRPRRSPVASSRRRTPAPR